MDSVAMGVRAVLTGLLLLLTVWWLYLASARLGTAPQLSAGGKVVLDPFQRSKDMLLVVLPLLTTALGYWFGAAGRDKAERKADQAQDQVKGLLDSSTEPGLLDKARNAYPDAFGINSTGSRGG